MTRWLVGAPLPPQGPRVNLEHINGCCSNRHICMLKPTDLWPRNTCRVVAQKKSAIRAQDGNTRAARRRSSTSRKRVVQIAVATSRYNGFPAKFCGVTRFCPWLLLFFWHKLGGFTRRLLAHLGVFW